MTNLTHSELTALHYEVCEGCKGCRGFWDSDCRDYCDPFQEARRKAEAEANLVRPEETDAI